MTFSVGWKRQIFCWRLRLHTDWSLWSRPWLYPQGVSILRHLRRGWVVLTVGWEILKSVLWWEFWPGIETAAGGPQTTRVGPHLNLSATCPGGGLGTEISTTAQTIIFLFPVYTFIAITKISLTKKNNEKIKSNSVFLFGPGVPQGFVLGLFFFCIYTFTGSSCDKTLFMTASTFKCVSSWYIYTLFTGCDETTNSTVKGSAVTLLHVIVNVLPCIHIKVLFHNKLELKMLNLNHCHFCIYYLKLKNVMVLTAESSNSIFIFGIMNYAYVTMSNHSKLHFFHWSASIILHKYLFIKWDTRNQQSVQCFSWASLIAFVYFWFSWPWPFLKVTSKSKWIIWLGEVFVLLLYLLQAVSHWRVPPQTCSCSHHPHRSGSGPREPPSPGRDHSRRAAGKEKQMSHRVTRGHRWWGTVSKWRGVRGRAEGLALMASRRLHQKHRNIRCWVQMCFLILRRHYDLRLLNSCLSTQISFMMNKAGGFTQVL